MLLVLLENGDGADLGSAFAAWGEAAAAGALRRRGARALSRRSLAFWSLLLGAGPDPEPDTARAAARRALWPLA